MSFDENAGNSAVDGAFSCLSRFSLQTVHAPPTRTVSEGALGELSFDGVTAVSDEEFGLTMLDDTAMTIGASHTSPITMAAVALPVPRPFRFASPRATNPRITPRIAVKPQNPKIESTNAAVPGDFVCGSLTGVNL